MISEHLHEAGQTRTNSSSSPVAPRRSGGSAPQARLQNISVRTAWTNRPSGWPVVALYIPGCRHPGQANHRQGSAASKASPPTTSVTSRRPTGHRPPSARGEAQCRFRFVVGTATSRQHPRAGRSPCHRRRPEHPAPAHTFWLDRRTVVGSASGQALAAFSTSAPRQFLNRCRPGVPRTPCCRAAGVLILLSYRPSTGLVPGVLRRTR